MVIISQVGEEGSPPLNIESLSSIQSNHTTIIISQVRKGGLPPLKLEKLSRVIAITQE